MLPSSPASSPSTPARVTRRAPALVVALLVVLVVSGCASGVSRPATDVDASSATLRGEVSSPFDGDVAYWFEYGRTIGYGSVTPRETVAIGGREGHPVSATVSGLAPSAEYHFRLCVQAAGFEPFCGEDRSFTTESTDPPTVLSITAVPGLSPAFDPGVTDYVTRCGEEPVEVRVAAPAGTLVAVDQSPARTGRFSRSVALEPGERFRFSVTQGGVTRGYHVRCLPGDFPDWTFTRSGQSSLGFTLVTPNINSFGFSSRYVAFFDANGVPVWWYRAGVIPIDAELLADNTIAFANGGGAFGSDPAGAYQIRRLDGSLVRTLKTVGSPTDFHDLQLLANGNYLIGTYKPRDGVDLSAYGGPSSATVLDAEIQELTPAGALVWSWNSKDYIALSETGRWWPTVVGNPPVLPDGRTAYDVVHFNAIEPDGNSLLISMRHNDAIYRINRATGRIDWKLGGVRRFESLTVSGDDQAVPLGGQHDVRRLADGTVSLFDNGTFLSRPPRALRFQIDRAQKTAALVEKVTDPEIPISGCCGSARKLSSGGWLIAWGGNPAVGEYASDGSRVSKLTFSIFFTYRAFPVGRTRAPTESFRQGMDAMLPAS